jgi:hypothetical protein
VSRIAQRDVTPYWFIDRDPDQTNQVFALIESHVWKLTSGSRNLLPFIWIRKVAIPLWSIPEYRSSCCSPQNCKVWNESTNSLLRVPVDAFAMAINSSSNAFSAWQVMIFTIISSHRQLPDTAKSPTSIIERLQSGDSYTRAKTCSDLREQFGYGAPASTMHHMMSIRNNEMLVYMPCALRCRTKCVMSWKPGQRAILLSTCSQKLTNFYKQKHVWQNTRKQWSNNTNSMSHMYENIANNRQNKRQTNVDTHGNDRRQTCRIHQTHGKTTSTTMRASDMAGSKAIMPATKIAALCIVLAAVEEALVVILSYSIHY